MQIIGPKKLVKRASFVADLLNLLTKDIEISIDWHVSEESCSECQPLSDTEFRILIQDWLTGEDLIRTIGHEMVHVAQYCRGDLDSFPDDKMWKWKGNIIMHSGSYEDYLLSPWELEARALEGWIEYRWRTRGELH